MVLSLQPSSAYPHLPCLFLFIIILSCNNELVQVTLPIHIQLPPQSRCQSQLIQELHHLTNRGAFLYDKHFQYQTDQLT